MYAIICDAKKGKSLGMEILALTDRSKTKDTWWTSDNESLIMAFNKRSAAEYFCKQLRYNNAEVVSYNSAIKYIRDQSNEIMHREALASCEMGWDEHKDSF